MSAPARQVLLPKLTDRMTRGKLLRWLVREGASVRPGDLVAEVQTDKAAMQVESPLEGRVARYLVAVGDSLPVGAGLLELESPAPAGSPPSPAPQAQAAAVPTLDVGERDELIVLDQEELLRVEELSRAWREIPQAVVHCAVNVEKAVAMIADYNRGFRQLERKLHAERVVLAAALRALPRFPALNARFDGSRILRKRQVNLGLVVEAEGRELVAVLADAAGLPLPELLAQLRSLEAMGRLGLLTAEQRSRETIVAQVLPFEGAGRFFAPIVPPTVVRLCIGGVRGDKTQIVSLTLDCRALTVGMASEFLGAVRRVMANPLPLMFPSE